MLSLTPDGLSGAPPLRDRPALQVSYLSTRERGAGQRAIAATLQFVFTSYDTGNIGATEPTEKGRNAWGAETPET